MVQAPNPPPQGHGLGDNMRGASPSPPGKGVGLGAWIMMMDDGGCWMMGDNMRGVSCF